MERNDIEKIITWICDNYMVIENSISPYTMVGNVKEFSPEEIITEYLQVKTK